MKKFSKKPTDVVIVAAKRSAVGSFLGSLSPLDAHAIASPIIKSLLAQTKIAPSSIKEVIIGQILTAGLGQGPARQASKLAGLPNSVPALGINLLCGSGLKAVALAYDSITADHHNNDQQIIIAGGMESMSRARHAILMRGELTGLPKMGDRTMTDTMITDALLCAFHDYHMGQTAENVAKQFSISRADQDQFALASQEKTAKAIKSGHFKDEIIAITIPHKKGDVVFDQDEYPRATSMEKLSALKPAFVANGTVTAGNASGLNDGAAMVMVMNRMTADKNHLAPIATILGHHTVGVDPSVMGVGPIDATRGLLKKLDLSITDLDLIESNEAFAAQSLAVIKELKCDPSLVNVHGGAIALGHPVGASGARILVTLLHGMKKRQASLGLATLCIGGGMGVSMVVAMD